MRACLVSSGHLSDSSRVSEVSGNRFLDLGIGIHQPQDDEERHHGGDEIGVRYFPRPAMVSRVPFHFAYDDNRHGLLLRHTMNSGIALHAFRQRFCLEYFDDFWYHTAVPGYKMGWAK